MKNNLKKLLILFFISFLVFPIGSTSLVVNAEESEENTEDIDDVTDGEMDREEVEGMEDVEVDTGLEVEEVELSERKDFTETDVKQHLDGMNLIAENDFLVLYIHQETTEIAVKVKDTGHIWFSNPVDRESDTVPSGENKGILNSQVSVSYFHLTGQTSRMHSDASVKNKQFE